MHIFEEVFFLKLRTTQKQKKQTIQLILRQLECGRLADGKRHETDSTVFEADIKDKRAVFFFFFARWQATYFLYPLLAAAPF